MISIRSLFSLVLTIHFVALSNVLQGQSNVENIHAPFVYYSAPPLGSLTFVNNNQKIHSYGDQLILLDQHNLRLDTFQIEDAVGYNNIHSIVRIDSTSISVATNQLSYLLSIKENTIKVVKKYSRKQIREIVGGHSYAMQLHNGMIVFDAKNRMRKNIKVFYIIDKNNHLVKEISLEERGTDTYNINYLYPHQLTFFENKLGFNSVVNNEFVFIDIKSSALKRIKLPELTNGVKAQSITYDYLSNNFYLMKIQDKDFLEIYNWDVASNALHKINSASIPVHKIRCGIADEKLFFIDSFDNQRAWFRVPLNKLHEL